MNERAQIVSSPASSPTHLEIDGVTKSFRGHVAVEDISFRVAPGEFLAVLGPSGAGKTTLFRCMTGLLGPDSGTVRVDGEEVHGVAGRARRRVAVVFQQFNLVDRLTALDNVLAGRLGHMPAWRAWARCFERSDRLLALDCLDQVGLLEKATQRADSLSGGQQQRVAIARALAQKPSIIIADEPVASLDPQTSAGVLELLRHIARSERVSVVCSLHQVTLARRFADRVVGLVDGRLVVDVPAHRFDEHIHRQLFGTAEGTDPHTETAS
ncbi:phosphonate ABC transporter ATP-binding protein [Ancylobacter sp. 6x-1]|uniref:Phosphonate ABC transporter ATP-binding protein n=1 Tax=Ancylobacter crimeensis TaxID=2579147 RepID=A0ABT0D5S7_9HYPH|nr:phosphonate ABC transporter ATP-binding protein [Ancylobacter crimeensis]MCK0195297.1 phosphonate ABC transporter ATP-binding protein [Ancylobacter crimeensis]